MERKKFIEKCKRIVVKCGSAVLTKDDNSLDENVIENLADNVSRLINKNYQVSIVSSGAVAAGRGILKIEPKNIVEKQALASVGQIALMQKYRIFFNKNNHEVAQILLTHDDFKDRKRYLHIKENIEKLISMKIVPVINENDSVVVDEIKFGDNDTLAAMFSGLYNADLLILLTDIDGFYNANPKINKDAKLIESIKKIDTNIKKLAEATPSKLGSGGMLSKIEAVDRATRLGIPVIIANGKKKDIVLKILNGEFFGTFFYPRKEKLKSRKYWLRYSTKSRGKIVIDDGAVKALTEKGKSLLPIGIIKVEGNFKEGDVIDILDKNLNLIGKGITYYSSDDLDKIKQSDSQKIKEILGYKFSDEAIHRNNLVVIDKED